MFKFNFGALKKPFAALALLFSALGLIVATPHIYDRFVLRSYVGSKVVMITNEKSNSGGSGFFVQAPSGKTYILTNYHVCQLKNKKNEVFIKSNGSSRFLPRRVIEMYKDHDLCLVESFGNVTGLSIGRTPWIGDTMTIVGHPKLFPLVVSKSQYIGSAVISLFYIKDKVRKDSYRPVVLDSDEDEITFNTIDLELKTYLTTQIIGYARGGSSGSPIVNTTGGLVGVLFAGNPGDNLESYAVPLSYIKTFLKGY